MAAAVADNVAWCTSVCRSLARPTARTPGLWSVPDPPRWYPHRITVAPEVPASEVVAGLPDGTDAWVKDSHATLELGRHGFTPVVHASWVHRPAGSPAPDAGWSLVRSADELAGWAAASGTAGVVTAPLLADPGVRLVGVREGARLAAGAVLSCGTDVVGVSNVFSDGPAPAATWRLVVAAAAQLFPGRDLVGYEHGEDLAAARGAGFAPVGDLRIWHRPARVTAGGAHAA